MEAGRALDRRVGVEVFGYQMYHYDKDVRERCHWTLMDVEFDAVATGFGFGRGDRKTEEEAWEDMPHFSTDMNAAWHLIDWLCGQGYAPLVMCHLPLNSGWQASVIRSYDEPTGAEIEADGETAPLAICRLALKVQKHYLSDKASCDKENML